MRRVGSNTPTLIDSALLDDLRPLPAKGTEGRWRVAIAAAFALLSLAGLTRSAGAATIAAWDTSPLTAATNGYGPSPFTPTAKDANVTVVGLTRGSGVATTGTAAGRAWGGVSWTAASEAAAITASQFATFTVSAAPGFQVSFTTIGRFDYRRSAGGPPNGRLQYQLGSGAFVDGPAVNYSSSSSSGALAGPIDLSSITDLQNVPAGTTVTFRIVNWGGASGGSWYIFDQAVTNAPDFEIDGTVATAVTATSVGVETAANGTGAVVPSQTLASGQSITVYAVGRQTGGAFAGNTAASWSLTNVAGGVVAGDLVPAADDKSAVFTAHAGGTAVIHAAVAGLTSTDSGVITAAGTEADPSASGLATPSAVALNETVRLEVGVVPGAQPTSTGLVVLGDLSALGIGGTTSFHDDGLNGDLAAGDNIFSTQATIASSVTFGGKTIPITVNDAQGRGATTSIALRVLGNLTVFHMNDTHARITPHKWVVPGHATVSSPFENVGGAAALATAVLQSTAATPDALVLDGGDISEGNPLGDMGGNHSMVQFYEILSQKLFAQRGRGIDALVVGNHDVRDASYITNLEELNASGVPVISVNVRDLSTHQPHFAPYTTVTVAGVKVGILGYTTQSAAVGASLSSTLEVADADWNSSDSTKIHLATYVNQLRNTLGCDLVILLTHVGHSAIATDTTVDGVATTALLVDDGAAKLPEVAVTGHWHTWAETAWQPDSLHYKTIFTEAGSYMHYLGELHVDGHGNYISSVSHPLRNSVYAPDLDVQSFIDGLITQYNALHPLAWDAVLGYTANDLLLDERMKWWSSDEYPWSGNDTAGQWISDGVQWKCAQQFGACDIAFEVGGGVRSDIPAGPVTYTQAYETYPWSDDLLWRVNMTGQEVINFIATTNCDAAFSRALHVVAHDGVPTAVTFNSAPIDPNHTYTIGITDYIYAHPPAGWSWSDPSPLTSSVLARDGLIEFMQQYPAENPYLVGSPRYELDTQFAGQYRAVVTMMNDNDTKPSFEDGFIRLLSATPETLSRRGTPPVPVSLVNADGTINQANRLSEEELYRSYLGFKTGALKPGDIVEVSGKGSFFGGDPEFVDQEGIYANGQEFKIVGHDDSLAKPTSMPSISSFWDDAHKNHYVEFLARKASSTTVTDQYGTTLKLWDVTAFASKTIPGAVNDLLVITGIPTSESNALRFRCNTVDPAASKGIVDYPASSTVASHVDPVAPEVTDPAITLTATAGANAPTRTPAPAADAQVSSGRATTNSGASTNMFIQSSATDSFGNERAFLRFDLSTLPPGSVITSARLEMFCWKATGPSLAAEADAVTSDSWVESAHHLEQPAGLGGHVGDDDAGPGEHQRLVRLGRHVVRPGRMGRRQAGVAGREGDDGELAHHVQLRIRRQGVRQQHAGPAGDHPGRHGGHRAGGLLLPVVRGRHDLWPLDQHRGRPHRAVLDHVRFSERLRLVRVLQRRDRHPGHVRGRALRLPGVDALRGGAGVHHLRVRPPQQPVADLQRLAALRDDHHRAAGSGRRRDLRRKLCAAGSRGDLCGHRHRHPAQLHRHRQRHADGHAGEPEHRFRVTARGNGRESADHPDRVGVFRFAGDLRERRPVSGDGVGQRPDDRGPGNDEHRRQSGRERRRPGRSICLAPAGGEPGRGDRDSERPVADLHGRAALGDGDDQPARPECERHLRRQRGGARTRRQPRSRRDRHAAGLHRRRDGDADHRAGQPDDQLRGALPRSRRGSRELERIRVVRPPGLLQQQQQLSSDCVGERRDPPRRRHDEHHRLPARQLRCPGRGPRRPAAGRQRNPERPGAPHRDGAGAGRVVVACGRGPARRPPPAPARLVSRVGRAPGRSPEIGGILRSPESLFVLAFGARAQ